MRAIAGLTLRSRTQAASNSRHASGRSAKSFCHWACLPRGDASRRRQLKWPIFFHRCIPHSFATHLVKAGYDIRIIQKPPDHKDVTTSLVYTHALNKGGHGVRSPVDAL